MRKVLIVTRSIIVGVLLFFGGMWLGTKLAKQSTPKPAEPTQQTQVKVEKPIATKKVAKVVKPAQVVVPSDTIVPTPQALPPAPTEHLFMRDIVRALPPQATSWIIITGEPQTYTNGWGHLWLIDPNGNFQCPRLDYYPTSWTGGQEVWVYHIAHPERDWYTTWAPACYR